jgi:2-hydroxychromene-2-carboxylate isomerase
VSRPLEFWFEFASTYSYLSAARIEAACTARGVTLVWRPFLLGPIFGAQGWTDSPFNLYPAKGAYMWADMAREAGALGLPLVRPDIFPQNGLMAARVATAHPDAPWIGGFVRGVYAANFAQNRDISDPAVLRDVLSEVMDAPDAALASAQDPEVKAALKARTQEAMETGIFGAPSFVVDGTLFWGNDRLERALEAAA